MSKTRAQIEFQMYCERGLDWENYPRDGALFHSGWTNAEEEAVLDMGNEMIEMGFTPARSFAIIFNIVGMVRKKNFF